jgi:hypothetical protein
MSDVLVELDNGISVKANARLSVDVNSLKSLVESGVPIADCAKHFKVSVALVRKYAKDGSWLTPSKVNSLRKRIEAEQAQNFRRTGAVVDINEVKAKIWKERSEHLKEKTYQIAKAALEGVSEERASRMIQNPLGLAHMTTVVRTITGEQKEEEQQPVMAVNIGFLRSQRPTDADPVIVDV